MKIDIRSKQFGDTTVLGRISLRMEAGEIVALTGPSGIGKSTLARIVAGLDGKFDGRISRKGRVGFVFQEPTLLPWRTLKDNITIATGCDVKTALQALEQVELGQRADVFPNQLSLGQQRRVALARALAVKPEVLILDEAFASLDEATSARMRDLVQRVLAIGDYSTILVTHNLKEAVAMADRVLVLSGNPGEITLDHRLPGLGQRNLRAETDNIRSFLNGLGFP
ncbi:MAG: ABC transporter ATP-binding protein [Amylibacter sp.]